MKFEERLCDQRGDLRLLLSEGGAASDILPSDRLNGLNAAFRAYRSRRQRDACFGQFSDLFGEPAWDMLLDLYAADALGESVSVTSASIAACVPTSTAVRRLNAMEQRGLIERVADPADRRRIFVRITAQATRLMDDWIGRDS